MLKHYFATKRLYTKVSSNEVRTFATKRLYTQSHRMKYEHFNVHKHDFFTADTSIQRLRELKRTLAVLDLKKKSSAKWLITDSLQLLNTPFLENFKFDFS